VSLRETSPFANRLPTHTAMFRFAKRARAQHRRRATFREAKQATRSSLSAQYRRCFASRNEPAPSTAAERRFAKRNKRSETTEPPEPLYSIPAMFRFAKRARAQHRRRATFREAKQASRRSARGVGGRLHRDSLPVEGGLHQTPTRTEARTGFEPACD